MTVLRRRLARPLVELVISLLIASVIVFVLLNLLPGDVAQVMLGTNADPAAATALRHQLGLDRPLTARYLDWMGHLLSGNLGASAITGEPIAPEIVSRLAVTGWLVVGAMALAIAACIPVGIYAAVHRRRVRGLVVSVASQILMSVPAFLAGILLILLFSVTLGWFAVAVTRRCWTAPGSGSAISCCRSAPWRSCSRRCWPGTCAALSSTSSPTTICEPPGRSAGGCGPH